MAALGPPRGAQGAPSCSSGPGGTPPRRLRSPPAAGRGERRPWRLAPRRPQLALGAAPDRRAGGPGGAVVRPLTPCTQADGRGRAGLVHGARRPPRTRVVSSSSELAVTATATADGEPNGKLGAPRQALPRPSAGRRCSCGRSRPPARRSGGAQLLLRAGGGTPPRRLRSPPAAGRGERRPWRLAPRRPQLALGAAPDRRAGGPGGAVVRPLTPCTQADGRGQAGLVHGAHRPPRTRVVSSSSELAATATATADGEPNGKLGAPRQALPRPPAGRRCSRQDSSVPRAPRPAPQRGTGRRQALPLRARRARAEHKSISRTHRASPLAGTRASV